MNSVSSRQEDPRIAIICAETNERVAISRLLDVKSNSVVGGFKCWQVKCEKLPVVICESGVGKVNAAGCTSAVLTKWPLNAVIVCGVAGAIQSRLRIGDIIVSSHAVQYDFDLTAFLRPLGEVPIARDLIEPTPLILQKLLQNETESETIRISSVQMVKSDHDLLRQAIRAYEQNPDLRSRHRLFSGVVATGDRFVAKQTDLYQRNLEMLSSILGALCVEMEGSAVGQIAKLNETPFLVIRSICDRANQKAPKDFLHNFERAEEAAANLTLLLLQSCGRGIYV